MATGNKSGLEGDRSYAYKLAEGIDNDIAEAEDKKTDRTELKRALDENETIVLSDRKKPAKGWGVRKSLDGEIQETIPRQHQEKSTARHICCNGCQDERETCNGGTRKYWCRAREAFLEKNNVAGLEATKVYALMQKRRAQQPNHPPK